MTFGANKRTNVGVPRRPPRVFLAVLAFSLMPQAHVSLPDQTWLAGVYDGGDYDTLALMVMSDGAAGDPVEPPSGDPILVMVASAPLADQPPQSLPRASSSPPRGPPPA